MKVLFLVDDAFLAREHSLLERLAIGLGEEGCSVAWAVSDTQRVGSVTTLAQVVRYEPAPGLALINGAGWLAEALSPPGVRARDLAKRLEDSGVHTLKDPIRVVHAWGEACWSLAAELAPSLEAGLVFEVWHDALTSQARSVERRLARSSGNVPVVWSAPAPGLMHVLRAARLESPVELTRWGVHPSGGVTAWSRGDRPEGIAVLAAGKDPSTVSAALEGLAGATGNDGPMIFLDVQSPGGADRVWREARRLSLLSRLTLVSEFEERRDLPLRCDMLVLPEPGLGMRSLVLDAAAAAMTILARPEPALDELLESGSLVSVEAPSADGWRAVFDRVLGDRAETRRRAGASREFVRSQHTASRHALAVAAVYGALRARATSPA